MQQQAGPNLTEAERADLRCIAGVMLPADVELGVPGADDERIFADIVRSLGRDAADVYTALARLGELAGVPLVAQEEARLMGAVEALQGAAEGCFTVLGRHLLACYYRDDRVMTSLGLEPRPPFPKGNVLEQGDFSLLEPVRARVPMWRDVV